MRIGVMVGPERGRYASKIDRLVRDATWAEEAGLSSIWIPQIPDEFDALIAAAIVGRSTERIEIGTAVVPIQPQHPVALARQTLSAQAACGGRLTLGLGVSHHWIIEEMLGLPYDKPLRAMRTYLDVLDAALVAESPVLVDVDNEQYDVNQPFDITDLGPTPIMLAALGPRMLELCGERTNGTILWLADEKAIESHIAPRLNEAAAAAGRPAPRVMAGIPVCVCADDEIDAATARTNRLLSEAETSPNYQKLLDQGNAQEVGDLLAAGSEEAVTKRLRSYADAGATDINVRIVPIGDNRDELLASRARTQGFLASLGGVL